MYRDVNIKKLVGIVLSEHPETRSSDHHLLLRCWEMYGLELTPAQQKRFNSIPHLERFTRYRRKYQEEGQYLPAEPIARERHERAGKLKQEVIDWENL